MPKPAIVAGGSSKRKGSAFSEPYNLSYVWDFFLWSRGLTGSHCLCSRLICLRTGAVTDVLRFSPVRNGCDLGWMLCYEQARMIPMCVAAFSSAWSRRRPSRYEHSCTLRKPVFSSKPPVGFVLSDCSRCGVLRSTRDERNCSIFRIDEETTTV